jgi:hypothetical protein
MASWQKGKLIKQQADKMSISQIKNLWQTAD